MHVYPACCFGSVFLMLIALNHSASASASATTKRRGGPRGTSTTRRELWLRQVNRISTLGGPVAFKKGSKYSDDDWEEDNDDNGEYEYEYEYGYNHSPTMHPTQIPVEDASSEGSLSPFTFPPFVVTSEPSELISSDTAWPTVAPEGSPPFTFPPLVTTLDPSELDNSDTTSPTLEPTVPSADFSIPIPKPSSTSGDDLAGPITPAPARTPVSISMPEEEDRGEVPPPGSPTTSPMASSNAACNAAEKGDIYVTDTSITVDFQYELLTTAGSSLSTLMTFLDNQFQDFLALSLVDCSRAAENPDVQGVDTAFRSTVMDTPCTKIRFFDSSVYLCYQIKSAVKLYLSQTSTLTSKQFQDEVYQTMSDAINGPSTRRLGEGLPRRRRLFTSLFTDTQNDIIDLYFLNRPTPKVSQVARSVDQAKGNQRITGELLSGSFMGFGLLTLSVVGLIWYKRRRGRDNDKSHIYGLKDSVDYGYGAILDPSPGPTPSPLSVPPERSQYSEDLPATSLFEAYEAIHMEDGNQLFYRTVTTGSSPQVPRTRTRTQELSTVAHKLPDHQRMDRSCDELLLTPPPFLHKIPRPTAPINDSALSRRDSENRLLSLNKKREKSVDPPPSTRDPYYIDFDAQTQSEAESTDTYGMAKPMFQSKSIMSIPGSHVRSSGGLLQEEEDLSDSYCMTKHKHHSRSVMSTPGSRVRPSGPIVLDDDDSSDTYGMTKSTYHSRSLMSTPGSEARSSGRLVQDEDDSSDTYGMTRRMHQSRSFISRPGSHARSLGRLLHDEDDSSDAYSMEENIFNSRTTLSTHGRRAQSSERHFLDEDDFLSAHGTKSPTSNSGPFRSTPRIAAHSSEHFIHERQSSDDGRLKLASRAPQDDDSFNVSGFLNGHCSTIEGFYDPDRRVSADQSLKASTATSKKQSPTTLAAFWSDSSAMSPVRNTACSSVRRQSPAKLGNSVGDETSSCSSGHKGESSTSTDGVNVCWCDNFADFFHHFTPYGSNQDPSMEEIVGKGSACNTPSTASLSTFLTPSSGRRGRDRTPVVRSTNSQPDKRRSKRSSTLPPKNPPARLPTRAANVVGLGPSSHDAVRSLSRSRQPHQSSTSRGSPVPRFQLPSHGVERYSPRTSTQDPAHF